MGTKRFVISFRVLDKISTWLATLLGGGPDRSRVEVDPEEIRVRREPHLGFGAAHDRD
jgi:hypothetical protein